MKTMEAKLEEKHQGNFKKVRFVAVSATIPNLKDIAMWLGRKGVSAEVCSFGEEFRPVKLKKVVLSYPKISTNTFAFDHALNYKLLKIIDEHSEKKPTLVFCNTRKATQQAAKQVAEEAKKSRRPLIASQRQKLSSLSAKIKDKGLQELVVEGIGFHHA